MCLRSIVGNSILLQMKRATAQLALFAAARAQGYVIAISCYHSQKGDASDMGTLIGILIFVGFTIGIWFSYRLFMRGDTDEEKVAALLPSDFKPDLFYRTGDT